MTNRTAGELAALIDDEQKRQILESWRRYVNPTVGEALRDFEEQQVREQVRTSKAARPGAVGGEIDDAAGSAYLVGATAAAAWQAACEACAPPPGFRAPQDGKRSVWRAQDRAALLCQYEALCLACGKASSALAELHERWGYARPKSDAGGSLSKVLTRARKEREAQQPRRAIKSSA